MIKTDTLKWVSVSYTYQALFLGNYRKFVVNSPIHFRKTQCYQCFAGLA